MEINKIIHGDCLEVLEGFPNDSINLIVTDPPYNTGMKANSQKAWLSGFFDDDYPDEDYLKLVRDGATSMYRVLKDDSACYVFISWKKVGLWIEELEKVGFKVKNCIVWDKVVHGLNYQNYAYTHEFILFAVKGKFRPQNKLGGAFWRDIWHIKRKMTDNQAHETMKSEEDIAECIKHGSKEGDVVLDLFGGTCTTCKVARDLGRGFLCIEKDSKYVAVCNSRMDVPTSPLF